MTKPFKQIPISELRSRLAKLKRKVQLGHLRLVVTCYGEIVGFLVSLDDVNPENGFPATEVQEIPITKFRDQVHEAWELLQSGVDCIYLTFHTRPVVAFVSPRLAAHLPIPLTKDAEQISSLIEGAKVYSMEENFSNV